MLLRPEGLGGGAMGNMPKRLGTAGRMTAAAVLVLMFVITIANYINHGIRRDTDNQMHNPPPAMRWVLVALIVGEIGGFCVLLTGFAAAQFF